MGRVLFLTCFHQLLAREKASSFAINADEAVDVLASLVVDLQNLQVSLAENSFSLQWCTDVMNLLRKMHTHLLCFVQRVNNCIEEYMKQSLILLDFCNSLQSAISEMNRFRLLINVAAKKLHDEVSLTTAASRNEMERLERESKKLYSYSTIKKAKELNYLFSQGMRKTKSRYLNVGVVDALKDSMSILCLLVFSTILYPVWIKVDDGLYASVRRPQLKLLLVSLRKLVCSFFEGLDVVDDGINKNCRIRPVLVENIKMVESTVFCIRHQLQAVEEKYLKTCIDSMKNQSVALKEDLEMFEYVVIELFEEVVKGRNKVLAMITAA